MAKPAKRGFYFKDWVHLFGRARLADELKVHITTVDKWITGKQAPQSANLRAIKKLSGGRVDYVHILDGVEIAEV